MVDISGQLFKEPEQKPATAQQHAQTEQIVRTTVNEVKGTNFKTEKEMGKAVKENPQEYAGAIALGLKKAKDEMLKNGMDGQQFDNLARNMLTNWGISKILTDLILKAAASSSLTQDAIQTLTQQIMQQYGQDDAKSKKDDQDSDNREKFNEIAKKAMPEADGPDTTHS